MSEALRVKSYLKRANYYIAYKLLMRPQKNKDLNILLMTSLLQEDLSSKLKKGETTENIEASKTVDKNPIFELSNKILSNLKLYHAGEDDNEENE